VDKASPSESENPTTDNRVAFMGSWGRDTKNAGIYMQRPCVQL
jgi:hypothetical protein